MYPLAQLPTTFPYKEIALEDLNKLTNSVFYKNDLSGFKSKVDYYIKVMESSRLDLDALKTFFDYNDALDQARGIKLIDYIPELEQARLLIKDL